MKASAWQPQTFEQLERSPHNIGRRARVLHAAKDVVQGHCVAAVSLYFFAKLRRELPASLLHAQYADVIWQEAAADPVEAACACFATSSSSRCAAIRLWRGPWRSPSPRSMTRGLTGSEP